MASSNNDVVVQTENVKFRYSEEGPFALKGVDLTVHRGEFVALVGQNGAGKTTLAKHFNGLLLPTEGRVTINGVDTKDASVEKLAKLVGYCYQNPDHQIFASTVRAEVAFGPKNLGMNAEEVEEAVVRATTLVGLDDRLDTPPYVLGRGERQKLAVASILAMNSPLLIVDEPTTGMDLRGSRSIMRLLRKWYEDGQTIIVITHDMNIVAEFVPTTVVMAQGRVLAKRPTREIMTDQDLLAQADLRPPQVTRLAAKLSAYGVRQDILTVPEMLDDLRKCLGTSSTTASVPTAMPQDSLGE